jgi:hypothetical protein
MIEIIQEFTDGEIMDGWIKTQLKQYPPAGYDTKIEITFRQTYEEWKNNKLTYIVKLNRLESCD